MFTSWSLLIIIITGSVLTASTAALDNNIIDGDDPLDGPIISPSQNEIILQQGQNFTFSCKGKGMLRFKQQEVPEEITSQFIIGARNVTSDVGSHEFEIALDLYNVDKFAVGYYACYDSELDDDDVLSDVTEELNNTAHVAYIYVYVNGSDSLFAPMRQLVVARSKSNFIIACRPTTPDIKMNLTTTDYGYDYERYSSKLGFVFYNDFSDNAMLFFECTALRQDGYDEIKAVLLHKQSARWVPEPKITGGSIFFLEGETFSLNCTVVYQLNSAIALSWITPPALNKDLIKNYTNEHGVIDGILYYNLTIENAPKEAAGKYTCLSTKSNYHAKADFRKKYLNESRLELAKGIDKDPYELRVAPNARLLFTISSYPQANYTFERDGIEMRILPGDPKYNITVNLDNSVVLRISNVSVIDSGAYTMIATNGYKRKEATYNLRIKGRPQIDFGSNADRKYVINTTATVMCDVIGYPVPSIIWAFNNSNTSQSLEGKYTIASIYKAQSTLSVLVLESGNITCIANNSVGTTTVTRQLLVYDIPYGFGIENIDNTWFVKNQRVVYRCLASVYEYDNVTWVGDDDNELIGMVNQGEILYSYYADLIIEQISMSQSGNYTCIGWMYNGNTERQSVPITVEDIRQPIVKEYTNVNDGEAFVYQEVILNCVADAVPPPNILWFKDGNKLKNNTNVDILSDNINRTSVNSTVKIKRMQDEDKGEYKCIARITDYEVEKIFNLVIKENPTFGAKYIGIIGVIILALILLVLYLTWKIRKEKQFRKQLAAAGLLYFKEGVPTAINPELDIYEQAELLPYDEKFEFSFDNLKFGKQLGAGAFGVVHKAEARGIINAEETTTVAVKMVHKTADNMYIKALATELKIMVHIGKHPNIVNLLGACTKNVGKRELYVIVEYCQYGNLHNYLQKHRLGFIDQLTDNVDNDRFGTINRGFSTSSGTQSDYCGHSQNTDHTFLNSANTNRSSTRKDVKEQQVELVKESDSNYVQPQWRSNYTYYSEGLTPRPLTSGDLLYWAYQIAKGMEYLASRKVLHGDLAARNVLLSDDNIVKICDFGLARSIYKNDEYLKKENSPLPVKWLALECITDRIFSTQSDVWAFGIVLWELFSLAKTPYPNVSPTSLLDFLRSGHRLDKPQYANDTLYEVMVRCWQHKPAERPTFTELQRDLEAYVELHQRERYEDLNAHYVAMNSKSRRAGEPDYLQQMCAPDYNNHVTPSPSDVHKRFNLTPRDVTQDIPEYLEMSSPKNPPRFDFNASTVNRDSEGDNNPCEKTPMLNVNNLTTISSSESDHERNSPLYHNFTDRIEEETDDVFVEEKNNAKNINNSAVTNPTYIVYDDTEKKPLNNTNLYMNVKPNGLVK